MSDKTFDRRQAIAGAGAAAAFGGLLAVPKAHAAQKTAGGKLVIDVAVIGTTLAVDTTAVLPTGGLQGASFSIEGRIFPADTIAAGAGSFDPLSAGAIGIWLCRGWFINTAARPYPAVLTTQEYLFGLFGPNNAVVADQLVSSGLEGGPADTLRSVLGGTGKYRQARGEVFQDVIGSNGTTMNPPVGGPASNNRFTFTFQ